jgi:guanylate kinase
MKTGQRARRAHGAKRGKVFVISGPSGSGKTTLAEALVKDKRLAPKLARSISVTTRPKRTGERQGRDYFFLSRNDFFKRRREKKILEWTRYLGYYYGTPADFVEDKLAQGISVVSCLDSRGVTQLKRAYPRGIRTVFVMPPSVAELEKRIIGRTPQVAPKEIKNRLRMARRELFLASQYDYKIVNKKFTQALKELKAIVRRELGVNKTPGAIMYPAI